MTKTNPTSKKSILIVALASVVLAGILFCIFNALTLPAFLPCTHPVAQSLVLALALTLAVHLLVARRLLHGRARVIFGVDITLILLSLWLGSYPLSPLGFSSGRIPILRGFVITTYGGHKIRAASGDIVTLGNGTFNSIEPVMLPAKIQCTWSSLNDGALDDPHSCDTAYIPLGPDYDILRVRIRCGCGLPDSVGEIKVSIMP